MQPTLVLQAIEQSKDREPSMRAMALLHGARVLATFDKDAAKQAFGEGVKTAESLSLQPRQIAILLDDAVRIGVTADPVAAVSLFRRLPREEHRIPRGSTGSILVQSLAQSGDFETALALLEDLNYETGGEEAVVQFAADPIVQRRAILAARERWRAFRKRPDLDPFAQRHFYHLLSRHWGKLDPAEQESWLDEVLLALDTDPDHPGRFGFGEHVRLHTARDANLFTILNVLRKLKAG